MTIRFPTTFILAFIFIFPALAPGKSTEQYFAVYLQGNKIGHAVHTRTVDGATVTTVDRVEMTIGRGGMAITARTLEKSIETTDGKPIGFESVQDLGVMGGKTTGTISEGKLTVTTDSAGQKTTQTIDWPEGAVLAEGLRLANIRHGLKPGTAWTIKAFSPALMQTVEASVTVGGKETVDLLGRFVELTEVNTVLNTAAGQIIQTAYVNDDFETLRMTSSAMGMAVEMLASPKEFALAPVDVVEFFRKVTVKSPRPLPSMSGVRSITYYISPAAGSRPVFPDTDTQSSKTMPDGSIVLTVTALPSPPASRLPYSGNDPELLNALKRSRYVESDDPRVIALAKQAIGDEKDAWTAAKKIEKFVSDHVDNKTLSVGYASAAEVARSRAGDCTEHAVLVAAMCRAVGIPARVVAGLVYADSFAGEDHIFGPHAWAEVNIAGKWYGLDATGEPRGFAPTHITVSSGDGSPGAFLGIINTIGNFTITRLEVAR
ncbi:MAG TPA: transglutaminase-like domain-containing protein [Sedimentisphaerales bacterium]|nr:transglutaminase-like domain-containing protein [Sedimentisphaerales bacterium]